MLVLERKLKAKGTKPRVVNSIQQCECEQKHLSTAPNRQTYFMFHTLTGQHQQSHYGGKVY